MMSISEESVVAGIMTFLLYGALPLAILLYLSGARRRRQTRAAEEQRNRDATASAAAKGRPASHPAITAGDDSQPAPELPEP